MTVRWEVRQCVLILIFAGVVEREEIEAAVASALADPRCAGGVGLLWDGRLSQTPLSTDDLTWRFEMVSSLVERGVVRRAAVLLTEGWRATLDYFRAEATRIAPGFHLEMFTDESEAIAWLEAGRGGGI